VPRRRGGGTRRQSTPCSREGAISTSSTQLVTAAEAARILGVTRSRVIVLASSEPEFRPAEPATTGGRRWPRAAVEAWAAAHPDRGPLHPGIEIPPIGQRPWQVQAVVDLAHEEARALHHHWVGQEHLWLALLYPDCPGRPGRAGVVRRHRGAAAGGAGR